MTIWTNENIVDEYRQWVESPAGSLALQSKMRLIVDLISGWPRRGRRFLEVGCATGLMTEMFYHAGFDVTGLDCSPLMLTEAQELLGRRAEFFWAGQNIFLLTIINLITSASALCWNL